MGIAYNPTWNINQSLRISPNSVSPRLLIQAESGSFEATNQNRRQFISANGVTLSKGQKLYVEDIRDNKVYISNDVVFAGDPHCFYLIHAKCVDINKIEVEIE